VQQVKIVSFLMRSAMWQQYEQLQTLPKCW